MTADKNIYGLLSMMMLLEQIKNEDVEIYYIDLFCGAGGTSTGVELATVNGKKAARVIACVNHDKNAIASHFANHLDALHFTEDMRTLDLYPVLSIVKKIRFRYPNAKIALWGSLECTNFSKAKGGLSRNPDSRTLAEHLYRYIKAIDPDSGIENDHGISKRLCSERHSGRPEEIYRQCRRSESGTCHM